MRVTAVDMSVQNRRCPLIETAYTCVSRLDKYVCNYTISGETDSQTGTQPIPISIIVKVSLGYPPQYSVSSR